MSEDFLVREIATPMRAWQYDGRTDAVPDWVAPHVSAHSPSNGLLIERSTGSQWWQRGDWVVQHPNEKDLRWYCHRSFLQQLERYA